MSRRGANPLDPQDAMGWGGVRISQGIVVNVKDDPEKAGRAQIRLIGDESDEQDIPDKQLIWARPMTPTTSPNLKGVGTSARLLPGSVVMVLRTGGPAAQEHIILGTVGRGEKDDKTDTNPAVHGKGETFKSPPPESQELPQSWPTGKLASDITTTREAIQTNDGSRKREEDKVAQGQKKRKAGGSGKERTTARFLGDGHASIGADIPWDKAQNPKETIQGKINNKSAAVPSFLPMIEQLKQVKSGMNPNSIQSVGAGNLMGALQSLAKLFPKKKKNEEEKTEEERQEEEWLRQLELMAKEEQNNDAQV